jgi:hypothetical protein
LQQLAALQNELGHYADARQTYARFREWSPLLEKEGCTWLAARRSDVAYYCNDTDEAVAFAREAGGPLYEAFADNLGNPPFESRRVILDVGFVRQHYQTCVPAILTTLSRFWNLPSDHLEVAAVIC